MSSWRETEDAASSIRQQRCNHTIAQLIGGDPSKGMPKVGVCLSGGGWRAMTSACALFDALSIPLAPTETFNNVGGVKLMDTISHAFGLSGGSWALFTTLCGGNVNPFHQPIDPNAAPLPHPWLHGSDHCFDENVHQYDGLVHMLSQDTVDKACYRSSARQKVGFLSAKAGADTAIAAAMVSDKLGTTLVERWSNFIANDILNFVDVRSGKDSKDVAAAGPAAAAVVADTSEVVEGATPLRADSAKAQDYLILQQNRSNPSRNVRFSSLKELIEKGDLPFVVCAAIANRPRQGTDPRPSPNVRAYDWVEFTPWFSRNPPQQVLAKSTDQLRGYCTAPRVGDPIPLSVNNLMAICGSAFACDVACALPSGVSALVLKHVDVSSEPILGGGVTDVVVVEDDSAQQNFGVCRDAGIDFNVPLPPMLSDAGRSFDIIIVHDAGAGSKNAFELQRAIELGYLQLMPGSPSPLDPFRQGEYVRVFRGAGGFPTVIYFIGLVERGTHQIVHSAAGVRKDTRFLRENVVQSLLPIFLGELRVAKARLDHGTIAAILPPPPTLAVVRSSRTNRSLTVDKEEEEEVEALETLNSSSPPPSHRLNPLAESLVVNAMTLGKINDALDAYLFIEHALFGSVPPSKRISTIIALEERAVKTLFSTPEDVLSLPPITTVIDSPDLCEVFAEFGLIEWIPQTLSPKEVVSLKKKEGNLSAGWVDFYAAMSLLSSLCANSEILSRVGLPPTCPQGTLQSCPLFFKNAPESKIWNLLFVGLVKLDKMPALIDCVATSCCDQVTAAIRLSIDECELISDRVCDVIVDCCEDVGSDKVFVLELFAVVCSRVMASIPATSTNGYGREDVLVALARSAGTRGRTVNLLRISLGLSQHVTFASPINTSPQREGHLATIVEATQRNPSVALRNKMHSLIHDHMQFSVTLEQCCRYALPYCLREFIPNHLDDRGAVSAILSTTERHATSYRHRNRAACVQEIWTNGVASNLFRDWIVEECVNGHQHYWFFLAPRVREVKVPPTATPEVAQEAVVFAEKCRRLQLINVPGNLAHDLRSKLGELESHLLTRKDAVSAKLENVAGAAVTKAAETAAAAKAKVAGLFGRFGK